LVNRVECQCRQIDVTTKQSIEEKCMKLHPAGKVAAWSAVGVLALAGGAGAAESLGATQASASPAPAATTPTPGAPTPGTPGAKAHAHHHHDEQLGRRALHGEFVVAGKDGKPVTLDVQRGKFAAGAASGSFTVTSSDAFGATYQTDAKTKVRVGKGATGKLADLKPGTEVSVVAVNVNGVKTARVISVTTAKVHKPRGTSRPAAPAAPSGERSGAAAPDQGNSLLGA